MATRDNSQELRQAALSWLTRIGLAALMKQHGVTQFRLTNDQIASLTNQELTTLFDEDAILFMLIDSFESPLEESA